ncbi:Cysteine proteinase inhibitor 5 [Hibiscus syriacus]|uniref:Cysteine proteinase inhibitor 5 n=1 Tax=Hibiscus syriacus TaxID=106335 RepID=A0A6A3CP03_HIBSY|nr:cysteine proteinase inhibitor 5-like [Hibiscus syriacus]KAE8728859.1 Cysteine proteinase inhibitor 5 [Hibiscus syriacus]
MQRNLRFSIFWLSLVFLPLLFSDARKANLPGGWFPIKNINDPHVTEIAKFAVSEYNKQSKASLELVKVVKGESQVVSGMNYRLVLKAKDRTAVKTYQAVVWEKEWQNFKSLTSFHPING